MRKLLIIFCLLLSINAYGQITSEKTWPISVQKEIESLKSQKTDTVLLSYTNLGPWNDLPESCKDIDNVWIIYHTDQYFAKRIFCNCDSSTIRFTISSKPIRFFVNHINDFKTRESYFKSHTLLPPFQTDVSSDHLIFMTNYIRISINISDYQKVDSIWGKYPWIKPTIEAIDLTKATIQSDRLNN
jgi:hypothetical protein